MLAKTMFMTLVLKLLNRAIFFLIRFHISSFSMNFCNQSEAIGEISRADIINY